MKEEVKKSLTDLIDETLMELEELKKSRFAAAEIEIKGPGEGIAGKPSNGDLHAKKAEDDEDEDKDDDAMKAEGKNKEADPGPVHHAGAGVEKAEGKNKESDPGPVHHSVLGVEKADDEKKEDKKDEDEPHEDDPKHEEKEKKIAKKLLDMHKSDEEFQGLMKSFVEERVAPLEEKLSTIFDLVKQIAEQPVPSKGVSARAVPLMKSEDAGYESLSKSEVASKLFELKKSGTKVDSLDIARVEMGHDLQKIVEKYKIS